MKLRSWEALDVILFSGDAYVDHPAFGAAVIGRLIEAQGLKIAIVPQPNWQDDLRDFKKLGKPRLFFAVTAGNMDSMVNHYTANKRLRSDDAYSPDGKPHFRPDYAANVYCNILKDIYPDVPILLGGIEASLRRFTHYDYWSDKLMPSILISSKADMLVYGMGEKPLLALLEAMQSGRSFYDLHDIPQTAYLTDQVDAYADWKTKYLVDHATCLKDKKAYASNFKHIETESNRYHADRLVQAVDKQYVVVNPPYQPLTQGELDAAMDLPFTRLPHPKYKNKTIPAFEMIKFSVNLHRGCFGGCAFCTISAHQGKFIVSRSKESVLKEVGQIVKMPDFKGYISDLGGPSANMYEMQGMDMEICKACKRPSCIHPNVCFNLNTDHRPLLELYQAVDKVKGVKKSFIGSGVRYDLFLTDAKDKKVNASHELYAKELITKHVSGRLKVAPEHTSAKVLKLMRKPDFKFFHQFKRLFDRINKEQNLNQQLIPYFISSHPACEPIDMAELALETRQLNFKLEQVQDFTPTPMTLATEIYYSGYHPYTLEKVYTAKTKGEKLDQRKFFFWYKREYKKDIHSLLRQAKRPDLIREF